MKKFLKWTVIVITSIFVVGFLAFLYLIPPFDLLPREAFIAPHKEAVASSLQNIEDPVTRMIAERGKMLTLAADCTGCHTPGGDEGPNWSKYLAGGTKFSFKFLGSAVSRNLTPDASGLAGRTDREILRTIRAGIFHDGRVIDTGYMPWASYSNMTEEDLYAIMVYLRHLTPIVHEIPDWSPTSADEHFTFYPFDFAKH
jgi:hypothetical protein